MVKIFLLRMSFLKGTNEGHLLSRTGMDIKIIVHSRAYCLVFRRRESQVKRTFVVVHFLFSCTYVQYLHRSEMLKHQSWPDFLMDLMYHWMLVQRFWVIWWEILSDLRKWGLQYSPLKPFVKLSAFCSSCTTQTQSISTNLNLNRQFFIC